MSNTRSLHTLMTGTLSQVGSSACRPAFGVGSRHSQVPGDGCEAIEAPFGLLC
jgi:hypothetical protein